MTAATQVVDATNTASEFAPVTGRSFGRHEWAFKSRCRAATYDAESRGALAHTRGGGRVGWSESSDFGQDELSVARADGEEDGAPDLCFRPADGVELPGHVKQATFGDLGDRAAEIQAAESQVLADDIEPRPRR